MKYSNIQNRIGSILFFALALGMTSFAQAQNNTQVVQMDKQDNVSIKVQKVESPNSDHQTVKSNSVRFVTMEKSDKMEIVNVKGSDASSKTVPTEKTKVVQKIKSEKIDQ